MWDAVNDALFGGLIDGIHFKKGKFIPWLRISLPVILLATLALFHIPGSFSENGKLIWFGHTELRMPKAERRPSDKDMAATFR